MKQDNRAGLNLPPNLVFNDDFDDIYATDDPVDDHVNDNGMLCAPL